jgi:hypothetical protein
LREAITRAKLQTECDAFKEAQFPASRDEIESCASLAAGAGVGAGAATTATEGSLNTAFNIVPAGQLFAALRVGLSSLRLGSRDEIESCT